MRSGPELGEILDLLDRGDRAEARSRVEAIRGHPGQAGTLRIDDVLSVLDHVRHARQAVREGRLNDLVEHARGADRDVVTAFPWLGMYVGSLLQAAFRFTGDVAIRDEAIASLRRAADRVDVPEAAIPARAMMGSVHLLSGACHATLELCDAALDLARITRLDDRPPSALAHQFRGYVLFEWNRLTAAEAALNRAWLACEDGNAGVRSGVARVAAELAAARGRRDEAEEWLARLASIVKEPMTLRNREWLTAVRVRHSLGTGDLRALDDWLRAWDYRPETLAAADDAYLSSRLHELASALDVLESMERWADAIALAPHIHRVAADRRSWFDARALSTWAVALAASGSHDEADALFQRALLAGDTGSLVRVYIDGSPFRVRILERLAGANPPNVHARRVLASAPEIIGHSSADSSTLTERQIDVLRLVARGCSNKTIARELGVSLSTVKTHLRTAFMRLEAKSRTQAIARARERNLI